MKLPNGIDPASFRMWLEAFGVWITKARHIAVIMGRGVYWSAERRRLLAQLGQMTFELAKNGKNLDPATEALVGQIERIQSKLEREQARIQEIRSGD